MNIHENITDRESLDYFWNTEATRIFQEITYDLLEKAINRLTPEEKILIRHTYGLRKRDDRDETHNTMDRKTIANRILKTNEQKALKMRMRAEQKIFKYMLGDSLTR